MKPSVGIWTLLSRLIIFLIIMAAVTGVGLWYLPLIHKNQKMRQKDLQIQKKIEQQKALKEELESSVQALKTNATAIEQAARERLGYAAPDEIVIRFEPTQETNSRPEKSASPSRTMAE